MPPPANFCLIETDASGYNSAESVERSAVSASAFGSLLLRIGKMCVYSGLESLRGPSIVLSSVVPGMPYKIANDGPIDHLPPDKLKCRFIRNRKYVPSSHR